MHYTEISRISKPIARVIQGTTMIGSDLDEAKSFALLDQVFDIGCNTFDTAHVYSDGESERIIGRWMQARNLRDKVVIITKGGAHSEDRRRMTPFDIASDLHDSLARLKTNYIDMYLLHRDDANIPVEPIIDTLNEHIKAGRIHTFGASNWTHQRIAEANAYALANGLEPFISSSPQFSLVESMDEPWPLCINISGSTGADAREWYAQTQMPLLAWSPLASGFFSGRFRRDNLHTFGDREWDEVCVRTYANEANFQRLDRAEILASEKGLTAAHVALAYVMNQPMNVFAVVGSHSSEKFKMNIEASEVKLTQEEMTWLDLRSDSR
ncbi:MAG: aldo/keto reductase [Anaerolineales bacterium]|nr:aldo/keto reductase [Anaerolineales bacterium]MBX3037871.1 aldo/keto reductase [Anaerolineales bacterium]